jgi:hypothetical protein
MVFLNALTYRKVTPAPLYKSGDRNFRATVRNRRRRRRLRISQGSIEEVREAANIVEVASEFTALKRQGTNLIGLCPYPDHSEKTPSFSVSPEKNFCYCFG